jgi:hypothetical protein
VTVGWNKEMSAKRSTFIETFCVVLHKSLGSSPSVQRQTAHVTTLVWVITWLSCVLHVAAIQTTVQAIMQIHGKHNRIPQLDFSNDGQISLVARHNSV